MKQIGLISDIHASLQPLQQALTIFASAGVDEIFCAGDIAGYMDQLDACIELLAASHCHTVIGNHDRLYLDHQNENFDSKVASFLKQLPAFYTTTIENKRVYMVHAAPPDECHGGIKLRDKTGVIQLDRVVQWADKLQLFDYDVLIVGHSHQVFAENIGNMLVINPGSCVFNHSCAILRLPAMTVEWFALSEKNIEPTWNWGEHVIYAK